MKSPNLFNYEIRPCKFVERRMLLASLYQIVINMRQEYQYIGFGGLMFTDFKLFHKELSVNSMYSIEGGFTPEKLEFIKTQHRMVRLRWGSNNGCVYRHKYSI